MGGYFDGGIWWICPCGETNVERDTCQGCGMTKAEAAAYVPPPPSEEELKARKKEQKREEKARKKAAEEPRPKPSGAADAVPAAVATAATAATAAAVPAAATAATPAPATPAAPANAGTRFEVPKTPIGQIATSPVPAREPAAPPAVPEAGADTFSVAAPPAKRSHAGWIVAVCVLAVIVGIAIYLFSGGTAISPAPDGKTAPSMTGTWTAKGTQIQFTSTVRIKSDNTFFLTLDIGTDHSEIAGRLSLSEKSTGSTGMLITINGDDLRARKDPTGYAYTIYQVYMDNGGYLGYFIFSYVKSGSSLKPCAVLVLDGEGSGFVYYR